MKPGGCDKTQEMIQDWEQKTKGLLESKAGHVGTCVNSFDQHGDCTIGKHLPYRDASHFANAVEDATKVSKEHFTKYTTVPKEHTTLLHQKGTEFYHDKEHNVHIMYDTKRDVHHFYTEEFPRSTSSTIKKVLRNKYSRGRELI